MAADRVFRIVCPECEEIIEVPVENCFADEYKVRCDECGANVTVKFVPCDKTYVKVGEVTYV